MKWLPRFTHSISLLATHKQNSHLHYARFLWWNTCSLCFLSDHMQTFHWQSRSFQHISHPVINLTCLSRGGVLLSFGLKVKLYLGFFSRIGFAVRLQFNQNWKDLLRFVYFFFNQPLKKSKKTNDTTQNYFIIITILHLTSYFKALHSFTGHNDQIL